MRRFWLLFWRTYWGNVSRPGYLIFTFGLPLFIITVPVVLSIVGFLVLRAALPTPDLRPIAVVDETNWFNAPLPEGFVEVRRMESVDAAGQALASGDIQAYYHLPPTYWDTGEVNLVYDTPPVSEIDGLIASWLSQQIRDQIPEPILTRYDLGSEITHLGLSETDESFSERNMLEWVIVFALIYFARSGSLFTAGYMYDSIASEARNRTIEIMLTSLSRLEFLMGKLLALMATGLTQLFIWGGGIVVIAALVAYSRGFSLWGLVWQWDHTALVISMLFSAFVLDQIMAAAAGMLRVSGGAGPQLFNALSWVAGIALIYAAYFVPLNPHAPLAVASSMFPITAPIVMLIRSIASDVPSWQVWLSLAILWSVNAAGVVLLRRLLQRNLVAYAPRFNVRAWFKSRRQTI